MAISTLELTKVNSLEIRAGISLLVFSAMLEAVHLCEEACHVCNSLAVHSLCRVES